MTDGKLPIAEPTHIPVVFANEVANIGILNGVINITLTAAQFTPQSDEVVPDLVIVSRLRFDLVCAQQLHQMLGQIIEANTKPASTAKVN